MRLSRSIVLNGLQEFDNDLKTIIGLRSIGLHLIVLVDPIDLINVIDLIDRIDLIDLTDLIGLIDFIDLIDSIDLIYECLMTIKCSLKKSISNQRHKSLTQLSGHP